MREQRCLFCGGEASDPDHKCDGRQGAPEAAAFDASLAFGVDGVKLHARTGDAETSHAAMAAYDRERMHNAAALVVDLHRRHGPMADYQLRERFASEWGLCDQSLYRQARNQARNKGLIRDSGQRAVCPDTNRQQIVWEACNEVPQPVEQCPTCGKVIRQRTKVAS